MNDSPADPRGSIPDELLDRFLAGEATQEEADAVRRWAAEHPERRAWLRGLEEIVAREAIADVDTAWKRMEARMDSIVHFRARPVGSVVRPRMWLRAAVVVGLLVAGAALWQMLADRAVQPAALATLATRVGEVDSVRLADGSLVVLGPESTLRYPEAFDGDERRVELKGQALFTVEPRAAQPFRVHAAGAVTEVLGTVFDVRAYPTDSGVRVVVGEGRVSLRDAATAVVLAAGDLGRTGGAGIEVERGVDANAYLGWREGRLVFDGVPLRDALAQLERWHDADLVVTDSTAARRPLTATFSGESLDEVLDIIGLALNLRVERRGTTFTLVPDP